MARGLVSLGDCGESSLQGGHLQSRGVTGEIRGDGFGRGRQGGPVVTVAPVAEMFPVAAVRTPRALGACAPAERFDGRIGSARERGRWYADEGRQSVHRSAPNVSLRSREGHLSEPSWFPHQKRSALPQISVGYASGMISSDGPIPESQLGETDPDIRPYSRLHAQGESESRSTAQFQITRSATPETAAPRS